MTGEEWGVLGSSGSSPLGVQHWNLGRLLQFANHPSVDLYIHKVRRRDDGTETFVLMIDASDVDHVPSEIAEELKKHNLGRIPLATIAGSPSDFFEDWEDLGQLPSE